MTDDRTMLRARAVEKRYGTVTALSGVSLDVVGGQVVALVGESGSGKTTLLRCFNKMVDPDEGSVEIEGAGIDTFDPVELRRSIGYVQQEPGLLPHWTVLRNAAMVPWLRGAADSQERALRALDLVGLPPAEFARRWPRELSGGQRQRAAFARALAGEPRILLLDEPFGALDAITRADVRATFEELRTELGLTALLVTHDLREAFDLADVVAVMRSGGVEQTAPPDAVLSSPSTPYVAELVDKAGVR